jgi:hypothetical protein
MRYMIAALLVIASTGIMAKQPNGNHFGVDKNGNNGNHFGNNVNGNRDQTVRAIPEPGTFALVGLAGVGLVGVSAWRKSRK